MYENYYESYHVSCVMIYKSVLVLEGREPMLMPIIGFRETRTLEKKSGLQFCGMFQRKLIDLLDTYVCSRINVSHYGSTLLHQVQVTLQWPSSGSILL